MGLSQGADPLPVCRALVQRHGRRQAPLAFLSPNLLIALRSILALQEAPKPLAQSPCPHATGVTLLCSRHHSGCSHHQPPRRRRPNSVAPQSGCQRTNRTDEGRNEGGSNPGAAKDADQPCRHDIGSLCHLYVPHSSSQIRCVPPDAISLYIRRPEPRISTFPLGKRLLLQPQCIPLRDFGRVVSDRHPSIEIPLPRWGCNEDSGRLEGTFRPSAVRDAILRR